MNIILSLVTICLILLIVTGCSIAFYHFFEDSRNTADEYGKKIKRKWLWAFSISITAIIMLGVHQLYFALKDGLNAEQIGRGFGTAIPCLVFYYGLTYYFGYIKRGTKYILCITIIQLIHSLIGLPTVLLFSAAMILCLVQSLGNNSWYNVIAHSYLAIFMGFEIIAVINYLVNSIRLFNANREYKKMSRS